MLRKNPEHRPNVSFSSYLHCTDFKIFLPAGFDVIYFYFSIGQASELLKHPYLQPYVEQYRPSISPNVDFSPDKPRLTRDSRRSMAESQNSNSSNSDRDSLFSSDKNTPAMTANCDEKVTDSDMASVDDHEGSEPLLPCEEQTHNVCSLKVNDPMHPKPSQEDQSNSESRRPKTIRNIMLALKEGKARENYSPVRGNRAKSGVASNQKAFADVPPKVIKPPMAVPGSKSSPDTPITVSTKANIESSRRNQAVSTPKHQVDVEQLSFIYPSLFLFGLGVINI